MSDAAVRWHHETAFAFIGPLTLEVHALYYAARRDAGISDDAQFVWTVEPSGPGPRVRKVGVARDFDDARRKSVRAAARSLLVRHDNR